MTKSWFVYGALLWSILGSAVPQVGCAQVPAAELGAALSAARQRYEQGWSLYRQKAIPAALVEFEQALRQFRELGDLPGQILTLKTLRNLYLDQGESAKGDAYEAQANQLLALRPAERVGPPQALDYFIQSVSLLREASNPYKAGGTTAITAGQLRQETDSLSQSLNQINTAFQVMTQARAAQSNLNIALMAQQAGRLSEALAYMETALAVVEDIRSHILVSESRTAYFATVQGYYELYIDLLMQQHRQQPRSGYDQRALAATERYRARTLLELLAEARVDIRQGISPQLRGRERQLQTELNALEQQHLRQGGLAAEAERQYSTLLQEYQGLKAQIRSTSPNYAALTYPQPLDTAALQTSLADDTLLLVYFLGTKGSHLWAVASRGITAYELPSRALIEQKVEALRRRILDPRERAATTSGEAQDLAAILLKPVADKLGKQRLVVIPDGHLHLLPFGLLPVGPTGEPLLRQHEVTVAPSITVVQHLRAQAAQRRPAGRRLAVVADPVFSVQDDRVRVSEKPPAVLPTALGEAQNRGYRWDRLPFTRQEAQAITALLPADDRKVVTDFTANRTLAVGQELQNYQILHFATHGFVDTERPEQSGLVLSLVDEQGRPLDGYLKLNDLFNLNFNANLVVLSACQTGLGSLVQGEGLVGLTRGFMHAGVPRVVASLWRVDDEATAELMTRFYQKLFREQQRPAVALRLAQMEVAQIPRWQAPYYWAGFALQGEWQ
ncbi:MAG: CHAT domain-containing protein [Gloeomargaritaceae cyanobacterium C42_A2020_066]|nr:CHAT domain-containing protein [Gloeomargaritaceae cyanobacterium C42_A2020_066]